MCVFKHKSWPKATSDKDQATGVCEITVAVGKILVDW